MREDAKGINLCGFLQTCLVPSMLSNKPNSIAYV